MMTISKTREILPTEDGGAIWFDSLNASGRGKVVAVIDGPATKSTNAIGIDEAVLDDGVAWALRDVLTFAKRGEHGLSIR